MLYRYFLSIALVALSLTGARAERALSRVIEVSSGGEEVVLDAGRVEGLRQGSKVMLLREGEAIVHPLSGEILGIPQEPVGLAEISKLENRRANAVMTKRYSTPKMGDLAEYAMVVEETQAAPPEVVQVIQRVTDLEAGMKQYKKTQKSVATYPVFAQQVWDEMGTIKSYVVAIDERLIALEAQQSEDRNRLIAMMGSEIQGEAGKELTIRYSEDTDLKLRVAGKTLLISVEQDSLGLTEVDGSRTMEKWTDYGDEDLSVDDEGEVVQEGEEGWDISLAGEMLDSPIIFGGSLLFIAIIAGTLLVVIKRRYDHVMDGLEEYDEDFDDHEDKYEKR